MSVILDLKPDEEARLFFYAAAEGVTPEQFFARLLRRYKTLHEREAEWQTRLRASQQRIEQARRDSGLTEEEIEADIDAQIKTYRKERDTPEATS